MAVFKCVNGNILDMGCSHFGKAFTSGVFRIFQESLTNVARHSHATKVQTTFIRDNSNIRISIVDNGDGFNDTRY